MQRLYDVLRAALLAATAALMPVALYLIFVNAPEEKVMGAVQKIFYFHVPIAAVTFLSVFVLLAGAVGYLWTRRAGWDHLSIASAEVGLVFCTLVLITGPIWAKPAWGVWWTWEARLTTTLILWLLLSACLMVRGYAENREQGARLGAIVGIVAALDVPIIYKAVEWWRGMHPQVFGPGKSEPLAPGMRETFLFCMLVFFMLYGVLLAVRTRVAILDDRSRALAESLAGDPR